MTRENRVTIDRDTHEIVDEDSDGFGVERTPPPDDDAGSDADESDSTNDAGSAADEEESDAD